MEQVQAAPEIGKPWVIGTIPWAAFLYAIVDGDKDQYSNGGKENGANAVCRRTGQPIAYCIDGMRLIYRLPKDEECKG